eukprot:9484752-Pyramimonas_sp.AAC.1
MRARSNPRGLWMDPSCNSSRAKLKHSQILFELSRALVRCDLDLDPKLIVLYWSWIERSRNPSKLGPVELDPVLVRSYSS